jgi:legumain
MEGNSVAVQGKGTGKVLKSNEKSKIFLFFSDHGAPGLIAFPSKYLYAD